jgi:hypothetical protein
VYRICSRILTHFSTTHPGTEHRYRLAGVEPRMLNSMMLLCSNLRAVPGLKGQQPKGLPSSQVRNKGAFKDMLFLNS